MKRVARATVESTPEQLRENAHRHVSAMLPTRSHGRLSLPRSTERPAQRDGRLVCGGPDQQLPSQARVNASCRSPPLATCACGAAGGLPALPKLPVPRGESAVASRPGSPTACTAEASAGGQAQGRRFGNHKVFCPRVLTMLPGAMLSYDHVAVATDLQSIWVEYSDFTFSNS
jgi:hypothetical protein